MEYFLGAVTAFISMLGVLFLKKQKDKIVSVPNFRYNQSYYFELIKPAIPILDYLNKEQKRSEMSQAKKYLASQELVILFMDNQAYWIKDNAVYVADVIKGNQINKESAKVVDTMAMDKVQLDKMMFIVEKLSEGTRHDSGYSGHQGL